MLCTHMSASDEYILHHGTEPRTGDWLFELEPLGSLLWLVEEGSQGREKASGGEADAAANAPGEGDGDGSRGPSSSAIRPNPGLERSEICSKVARRDWRELVPNCVDGIHAPSGC